MTVDFSFSKYAAEFDAHIRASIPGYDRLNWWCQKLSRRFVQSKTCVFDIGCSTGSLIASIRDTVPSNRTVRYLGVDSCPTFQNHWREIQGPNLEFRLADALEFDGYGNASLAILSFTLQFISERRKLPLLRRVYSGLEEGGALLIAEKTLANSPVLQEAVGVAYHDYKCANFTTKEILEKERDLQGVMTPWPETQLNEALEACGFETADIQPFWQDGPFVGLLAVKRGSRLHHPSKRSRASRTSRLG